MKVFIMLQLACLAVCLVCSGALADCVVQADGSGDYPTIQAAVDAVSADETIWCGDGTYTGAGNTNINFHGKDLVLCSISDNPWLCIIDCEHTADTRGFYFNSGETYSSIVRGFTVRNGNCTYDGGGMWIQAAMQIINCIFENNTAGSDGGGIGLHGYATIFSNCLIINNTAGDNGGGISTFEAAPIFNNCKSLRC